MADEEPAPAPTPSLEDGLYTNLKNAIGEACQGVDNNTASLAVQSHGQSYGGRRHGPGP